eukprot:5853248-Amphidinium_carterae.1
MFVSWPGPVKKAVARGGAVGLWAENAPLLDETRLRYGRQRVQGSRSCSQQTVLSLRKLAGRHARVLSTPQEELAGVDPQP